MGKETKTNAMRLLDRLKIPYEVNTYVCDEFVDGVHIADMLGQPYEQSFKTLVAAGKSGAHYVFVVPIAEEVDLKKAAVAVGEKSVSPVAVKNILALTGYVRGGVSPLGMKKAFPTVLHSSASEFSAIIISGGRLGAQIFIAPADLLTATGGKLADIVA